MKPYEYDGRVPEPPYECSRCKELEALVASQPAWHKRPTGPGWWMCLSDEADRHWHCVLELDQHDIDKGAPFRTPAVYGPIPQPPDTTGGER